MDKDCLFVFKEDTVFVLKKMLLSRRQFEIKHNHIEGSLLKTKFLEKPTYMNFFQIKRSEIMECTRIHVVSSVYSL